MEVYYIQKNPPVKGGVGLFLERSRMKTYKAWNVKFEALILNCSFALIVTVAARDAYTIIVPPVPEDITAMCVMSPQLLVTASGNTMSVVLLM